MSNNKHVIWSDDVATVTSLLEEMLETDVVDAPDVARVLGTSARSVARWAEGASPRRDNEERLLELKAVVDALRQVMRDEPARLWLRSPVPALDYRKPIEFVEQGDYLTVIGAILAIGEGVTA